MMAVGWMAFLGSWLMNALFYKVHPSSVDFSKKGMREKLFIHVQGEKRYLCGYKGSKGEKYCNTIFFSKLNANAQSRGHTKCLGGEILFLKNKTQSSLQAAFPFGGLKSVR